MIKRIMYCLLALVFFPGMAVMAQDDVADTAIVEKTAPNGWHLLDRKESGYYGISLKKAYDFLEGRKSKTVVVAVLDSGIDTLQEDLKPILWRNPGEIPHNDIDDDKNGYVDDYYGWNFIGGKDGRNVKDDSYEAARVYWNLKSKYGATDPDTATLTGMEKREAVMYLRAKAAVTAGINATELMMMKRMLPILEEGDSIIAKDLGKEEYSGNDLKSYTATTPASKTATMILLNICKMNNENYDITNKMVLGDLKGQLRKAESADTPPENFRADIVKDDYYDITDRYYGNADVMTGSPMHGTHCAGIIGAIRNNGIGVKGVADNVRIMAIRAVPNGDEHDKDIANGIRYAVDNGAQIISMSFGKSFSPQKKWVDDAVKYAQSKGVLLVHAAGNDHSDVDSGYNFPSPVFLGKDDTATNFITVGASGDPTNGGFTASFSNYGEHTVDVFAPGVNIFSTLPGGNKYGNASGTSMAAPVVSGLAALLLSYFPDLSAEQLKYVIVKSVTPIEEEVILPGTQHGEQVMVPLSKLSRSGGEVNAYNAVKLASTLEGNRDKEDKLPPSKVKRRKKG